MPTFVTGQQCVMSDSMACGVDLSKDFSALKASGQIPVFRGSHLKHSLADEAHTHADENKLTRAPTSVRAVARAPVRVKGHPC